MRLTLLTLITMAALLAASTPALATDAGAEAAAGIGTSPGPALPAGVPDANAEPVEAAWYAFSRFRAGEHWAGAGMALMLIVALVRRYIARMGALGRWATTTDHGGTALTLATSIAVSLGMGLVADGDISWQLLEAAIQYGVMAAAGWSVVWKRLVRPLLARWL